MPAGKRFPIQLFVKAKLLAVGGQTIATMRLQEDVPPVPVSGLQVFREIVDAAAPRVQHMQDRGFACVDQRPALYDIRRLVGLADAIAGAWQQGIHYYSADVEVYERVHETHASQTAGLYYFRLSHPSRPLH